MSDEAFLRRVLIFAVTCFLALFLFLIAFWTSLSFALFLLVLLLMLAGAIRYRKKMAKLYTAQVQRRAEVQRINEETRIMEQQKRDRLSKYGTLVPGIIIEGNGPTEKVYFWGEGAFLNIGRGILENPLVYAVAGESSDPDASLIEGNLPVAPKGTSHSPHLSYWPNYRQCSPEQRSVYLDWHLDGRNNPNIEIGYVFVYFYGLERRIIIDSQDYAPIIQEIIRLLGIYTSNSFRRYAEALLWKAVWELTRRSEIPAQLLSAAYSGTREWQPDVLYTALGLLCLKKIPLPSRLAYLLAQRDPRARRSVVVTRRSAEFRELFKKKYKYDCGTGLILEAAKNHAKIVYQPASGTLLRHSGEIITQLPNVLGKPKQFKFLADIWNSCIEELKSYDRVARSAHDEVMTTAKYEALPPELRKGDHPEIDQWCHVSNEYADEAGWTVAPVSCLAKIKGYDVRDTLTKRQCEQILATADCIGFGIEPDTRLTGKNYKWDEPVCIFLLEDSDSGDSGKYIAASTMLRLGISIAQADNIVDEVELKVISDHLEQQFDLPMNQAKRLKNLRYLLLKTGDSGTAFLKRFIRHLTVRQRQVIGNYLVGIAAADQIITEDEHQALRRAYRLLELNPDDLAQLFDTMPACALEQPVEIKIGIPSKKMGELIPQPLSPAMPSGLRLNMDAVRRIMSETKEVSELLQNAMHREATDEDSSIYLCDESREKTAITSMTDEETQVAVLEQPDLYSFAGLDQRFHTFLDEMLSRDTWPQSELSALAKRHSLMLNGAIESINEWSQEQFGDWIIEEGDPVVVRKMLMKGNG